VVFGCGFAALGQSAHPAVILSGTDTDCLIHPAKYLKICPAEWLFALLGAPLAVNSYA
jgi:hypothetical protein